MLIGVVGSGLVTDQHDRWTIVNLVTRIKLFQNATNNEGEIPGCYIVLQPHIFRESSDFIL